MAIIELGLTGHQMQSQVERERESVCSRELIDSRSYFTFELDPDIESSIR